jgi:hypothetical protein
VTASSTVEEGTQGYSGEGVYRRDNHAWVFQAPNGRVFHAGPGEAMHWIDVAGNGNVDDAGSRGNDQYAMNGNAVMYDIGKILKVGGAVSYASGNTSTFDAVTIDINGNTPIVSSVCDLQYNRTMPTSVVLPTGEVLVVGGLRDAEIFTDANTRMIPELWNPVTGNFRSLAPMAIPRTYHSAAILLPDGRVMAGGGGLCDNCSVNHPDVEIFSPPYLFNTNGTPATRPQITSSPAVADHNTTISVTTNTSVNSFSIIRLGSATHSVNNEQRRVPLTIASNSGNTYQLNIPQATIAVPGYYILFAIKNGVPSVSASIRVGNGQNGPGGGAQARYALQTSNIPGTIQAEYYDLGGQGIAFNDTGGKNGDTNFRPGDNVDCNELSNGNYKVGWTAAGEWLEYTVDVQAGTYDIIVTATSSGIGIVGDLQVSLDGIVLGTADIVNMGGWLSPQDFTISNVNLAAGSDKVLRLTIVNGQSFDIDKVNFVRQISCPDDDNDGVCNANDLCPNFDDGLIGSACDDGDVCTINDVYGSNCQCAGTYVDSDNDGTCDALDDCTNNTRTVFDQNFSNTIGMFTFLSGAFSNSQPTYESISLGSQGTTMNLGGVDNATITNMSLGLLRSFLLPESGDLSINITYTLNANSGYEPDEIVQALASLDGQRISPNSNDYLSQIAGGSPTSTGSQSVTINIPNASAGNHSLVVGVFNTK